MNNSLTMLETFSIGVTLFVIALLGGCSSNSSSQPGGLPQIAMGPATASLDVGQAVSILVTVGADSTMQGATLSLSGPGTLGTPTALSSGPGNTTYFSATYSAPASVLGIQTATVTATAINLPSETGTTVITINPAVQITTATLPSVEVNTIYSSTLAASGGMGTKTWALVSGILPAGLTLNGATGLITGTPLVVGSSSIVIGVTDSAQTPQTATQGFILTVVPPGPTITTTLPGGVDGTAYSQQLTYTGGNGSTATFNLAGGTLPAGFTLSSAGVIAGTPNDAQVGITYSFGVTATVGSQTSASRQLSLAIALPSPPVVTTTTLPNGVASAIYSQQLAYTGGYGTPAWSLATGTLPIGLTMSASGSITGTLTNADSGNTFTFSVKAVVGLQTSASQTLTIAVTAPANPVITNTTLPIGYNGIGYSQKLTFTGGNGGAATWALLSGSLPLPPGLSLSSSGLISGLPTTQGTYSFSVTVTVGSQVSAAQAFPLKIQSLVVNSGASAAGEIGLGFSFNLTAQGGTKPYTWSLAGGSLPLPGGLILNAGSGAITGLPAAVSSVSVAVTVTDAAGTTSTQAMTFTINAAASGVNDSELKGQYAFLLSGFDASGKPLASVGTFTADGNGNVTTGTIETNGTGLSGVSSVAVAAGTFSVGSDNRGRLTLATTSGSKTFVLALNSISNSVAAGGYLTEFDPSGQSLTGVVSLQTAAAFTTASIKGGFAFGTRGYAVGGASTQLSAVASIGEIQFSGNGAVSSAEYIASDGPSTAPVVPSSGTIAIAANGRGTLSLVRPNSGGPINWIVYVVSATNFYLMSADPASGSTGTNDLLLGIAMQQTTTNGNFTAASLNGSSIIRGDSLGVNGIGSTYADVQIGLVTFNGAGTIAMSVDENFGGKVSSKALAGTYAVATNGRVSGVLAASGFGGCTDCTGGDQVSAYLVGAGQGFVMDFAGVAGSMVGSFEPQAPTGFNALSFGGAYATGTLLPQMQQGNYDEAVLVSDGTGGVTGTADVNFGATLIPDQAINANYVVAPSGRSTLTSQGDNAVLYIISPTKAVLLDLTTSSPVIVELLH